MRSWLRRAPSRAPAVQPTAGAPSTLDRGPGRDDDRGGHALRAASRLHAFNRYEIKYLVPTGDVPALRERFAARMDRDSHGGDTGYGVWSVYYDTAGLRFYWEKIEGLKFRRKLRVRHYGEACTVTDDSIVHVEIKQRVNRVTQKRRMALPYGTARRWLDERQPPDCDAAHKPFVDEVTTLIGNLDLRPIVTTGYLREAFVGRDADLGLRVTLDHKVHGRDRDFHFASGAQNRYIIPPKLAIVEIKANERVPYWVTDLAARIEMSVVRISKYCQSVQAFGLAPRSMMGSPELTSFDAVDHPTPADPFARDDRP